MAKGENIFKRKDGRWEARYIKERTLSGKARYGYCYGKTYKEAKEKVTQCRLALLAGAPPTRTGSRRLGEYCSQWLESKRSCVKPSTYIKYETAVLRHIQPELGDCLPRQISTALLDGFSARLRQKGLAPKSVHDILVTLRGIRKYTAAQPGSALAAAELHYPKLERREMRVLSLPEQERLVAYLLADLDFARFGLLLALFTGVRIGELCALRWRDISLPDQTIRITSTMQRLRSQSTGKTEIHIGTAKSSTSVRTIPMTQNAAQLCARMSPGRPECYVLTGTEAFMEPRALQYRLGKYTRACGLEGVHCHTLRHTFATRAVEVGFEIKSLSEILGHATTGITLERYVHASIELKRNKMQKLSAVGF